MLTVSVIIPNYNYGNYLSQCIDSVLAQTYPIQSIIIFDDCSTDNSREILQKYAALDDRIRILTSKKNTGDLNARDISIKSATSDYICTLDADDFFFSRNKIKREMEKAQDIYDSTGKKPIVFSQTVDVNEEGIPLKKVKHINLGGHERFRTVTRLYKNYTPRDYCFPKEAYLACGGYTEGLSLYEDWDLNLKFLNFTEFIYSGEYGTAYRHKPGGLSSADYRKHLQAKLKIFKSFSATPLEKLVFYPLAFSSYIMHKVRG